MATMLSGMISLAVSSVVLIGVFVRTVKDTSTAGWTTSEVSLWGTVTLVAIAGFIYGVLSVFGLA